MPLPPLAADLPPEALAVLANATRIETPSGEGTMAWHVWGHPAAEPLVLFHGGSGSWTHWVRNVEALAALGRRVIVADLPGFGDSAAPVGARDADEILEPLAEGIRQVAGPDRVEVVGFSFGGLTAGLLAAGYPGLVRHLVLVGAPAFGLRDKRLKLFDWRHLATREEREAMHRRNLGILMLHDPATIDVLAVALQVANTARDRMRRRRIAMTDLMARIVPTLACRVDAIYGEHDALYEDALGQLQQMLEASPNFGEFCIVPGAGHWVQYEQPAEFLAALQKLL